MYFVYIIEDSNQRLYTGVTDSPKRRLDEHNKRIGATFTKTGQFKISFLEEHTDLASARKREIQIKKWRRQKKLMLVDMYNQGLTTSQ